MRNSNIPPFAWPFIFSILLSLCTLVVSGVCLGSDQQTLLLQLKNSLNFSSFDSTKLVYWNESSDCCSWEGVTCDEEGLVDSLDLHNEGINGALDNSSVLFDLQHLKWLDLSLNNFNSTISSRIGNLTNLISLDLSYCELRGTFPSEIFQVSTLELIHISSNELLEVTLPEFPVNNSLQVLFLSSTKFSGRLPASLGNLTNLISLGLSDCGLRGTFPSEIFQVPTLEFIDISSNELLEGTLPEFPINNSLRELFLSSTKFSGRLPTSLGNLRNLSRLDLSINNFTGSVPSFHLSTKLTIIDLSHNGLTGEIPLSLFALSFLEKIWLSNNQFSGPIPEFKVTSSSSLETLDLSSNNLEGLLPMSMFKLRNLESLDMSHNKFNGVNNQKMFRGSSQLSHLNLSYNNLKSFPDLENLSKLTELDLSKNQISGEIPKWIWEVGNRGLERLNISHNHLVGMQEPFFFPEQLEVLALHSNQLQGNIPTLPQNLSYLDLSSNNFTTSLPYVNNSIIAFLSLSNNNFTGVIPEAICAIKYLSFLDLSHNKLSGRIPTCLFEASFPRRMLNLGENNFEGLIPDVFPEACTLQALDLHGNFIEGAIPKSLSNCYELEILDLGHNQLIGNFPCLLKNISTLHILILRSNKLFGSIECLNANGSWPMLQIFDLAHNNFSGELPRRWLTKLKGMMADGDNAHSKLLSFDDGCGMLPGQACLDRPYHEIHYVYTEQVTSKGLEMKLEKILSIFTFIDLSRNNFHGQIPAELGQLKALYTLNLSHNALEGQIPSSMGNLRNLESLDLSWNNLDGTIPTQLRSLNFLSFLNLSFNQLVGLIPTGGQFQTLTEDSFKGNKGLYGCPLIKYCSGHKDAVESATKDSDSNSGRKINWNLLSAEMGLFTGFGCVVSPLMFSRRWRIWYYERVDDIIFKIFPLALSRKWFLWTTT